MKKPLRLLYEIEIKEANNKRFTIEMRNKIFFDLTGMSKGKREYKRHSRKGTFADKAPPFVLVITGSYSYGFITSLERESKLNWMKQMEDLICERRLVDIVLPATHDSSMSTITSTYPGGDTKVNTQTQGKSIYNQRRGGARWFDLRVWSQRKLHDYMIFKYWTAHVSDSTESTVRFRASGVDLKQVLDGITRFTQEYPSEVVILQFRYLHCVVLQWNEG